MPIHATQAFGYRLLPEFHLSVDGKIVRAKDVIKTKLPDPWTTDGVRLTLESTWWASCRALAGNAIRRQMQSLNAVLPPDVKLSLKGRPGLRAANGTVQVVAFSDLHGKTAVLSTGAPNYGKISMDMMAARDPRFTDVLDVVVGTIGTILSPIPRVPSHEWGGPELPANIREAYKAYGPMTTLDYRTLGNWWMTSYQTMSLVTGLMRWVQLAVSQSRGGTDYIGPILAAVPAAQARAVIAAGDRAAALANWQLIRPLICAVTAEANDSFFPLTTGTAKAFDHFLARGLDHWFKHDLMAHWTSLPDGHGIGWESYRDATVRPTA